MTTPSTSTALASIEAACHAAGFDLTHAFDVSAVIDDVASPALPRFGRDHAQGLVVGNSAALWDVFSKSMRSADDNPLDDYVERTIDSALAASGVTALAAYGHVGDENGFWPLQRIAAAAGLGRLADSHLLIHPTFGPWVALRAVIVFDADVVRTDTLPQPAPCDCAKGCLVALAHAQQARGDDAWRAWLAVRDACPVGANARYSDEQIRFHYTSPHSLLRKTRLVGPVPTLDD